MRKQIIGYVLSVLAACVVNTTDGLAGGGTFTRGCAARDMQIMMMIEAAGIPPRDKMDAVRTIMHARIMCLDGQVMDALAVYDTIAQSIASDWDFAGQRP
jgi:hypothetical protein